MDAGKEETDLTDVKTVNGAVAFNNNTGKALKIISWSEGPLAAYNVYSSPELLFQAVAIHTVREELLFMPMNRNIL